MSTQDHAVFICHASEDKDVVARPLALKLQSLGIEVWFDEFSLKWGDSLMKSITKGLQNTTYGIVIFSPNFFGKKWAQMELDALIELTKLDTKKILPLRYNLSHEELAKQQPLLSGILSRSWEDGADTLAQEIKNIINSERQTPSVSAIVSEQILVLSDEELFKKESEEF